MRTHIALLRGINVGGHGKVPMADLRRVLGGRGCADVVTHIQSGNVALTSPAGDDEVAATIAAALVEEFGIERPVVVFGRADYLTAVAANPFPQVTDPKQLHVLFRAGPRPDDHERIAAALAAERAKGGRGDAVVRGRTVWLHLPDGLGRSELATRISARTTAPDQGGTMRNLATVRKLADLLG
ncbi:hypothetical protein Ae406Ps2_2477 [Pseudonocardia sp. Ae406_Ps2]|uniref:DUF1697 domain-containing protein n=1 Tax=unclassified Pseudonocardia TaxID=2619320 RepID=UPI00094B2246|nr:MULTISPECIES: DUF1697 domain-containing protein [unclassified Pseudonocardia]OLL99773.1 hypothetical protein Ae331Ps2_3440c [Pseudonocardia sp. Ae331_Ps2]OLM02477.1 hypothetical protein Ae406Ps2_2477 [Pseudonocardia sp. Ae406_Ps2]OLM12690.1 hypothetical protein Ae505Ps2_2818c [Pseudonocardia sp. Ae505_Ps2]OLM24049.1 hypothetical protein Ae706Ps2_2482 [Pseudonocardia sp. Ae706_Ps2]OLM30003.1 hypothetical protein Ae717Ps2_0897c [Pseudonocardia sp. Ae717_Ps2]